MSPATKTKKAAARKRAPRIVQTDEVKTPSARSEKTRTGMAKAIVDGGKDIPRGRVFTAEHVERDQLYFTIAGVTLSGNEYVETFRCLPELPSMAHANLIIATEKPFGAAAELIVSMVQAAIIPEDEPRYERLISSKDHLVDLMTLANIATWMVEEYTGRPTGPSTD